MIARHQIGMQRMYCSLYTSCAPFLTPHPALPTARDTPPSIEGFHCLALVVQHDPIGYYFDPSRKIIRADLTDWSKATS